jgi:hypothetical protein
MTFFYDLNKKLDTIREKPELTHKQLNERDMSRAAKGYEKYGKQGMEALAKAGREGKALDPVRAKYDKYDNTEVDEGMGDMARKVGSMAKKVGGAVLDKVGHGSDADMIRDLQRKMGVPQTGMKPGAEPNPKQVKEKMNPAKAKSFAALAEPKDKITFADKIAGAKKEVDEMLGDVAAEAMKSALSGGQKKLDKNNNGKLDANDFAMLRKGSSKQATAEDDDNNPFTSWKKPRAEKPRVGSIERGHKHDIEHTATGRKVTRRVDDQGNSVGADDAADAEPQKRGRGRPAGTGSKMGAKGPSGKSKLMTKEGGEMKQTFAILDDTLIDQIAAMNGAEVDPDAGSVETYDENTARQLIAFAQKNPQRLKRTQSINTAGMRPMAQRAGGTATGPEYGLKEEGSDLKAAMALLKKAGYKISKDSDKAVDEEKTTKRDNRAEKAGKQVAKDIEYDEKKKDGIHGKKRGSEDDKAEKAGKKVAKDIEYDEKKGRKEVEETTVSGSIAPSAAAPAGKSKSGMSFGKGIYDSMNRDLEQMIAESMNISMNMNSDGQGGPTKSLTVTATDEDAVYLGKLLKMAGMGGEQGGCGCGSEPCSCGSNAEVVDENQPDWPTNTETSNDALQYSGGLNKPKSTGQTTIPVIASQNDRQESYAAEEEDAIKRMMEMAGIKTEAKKPDFLDIDKDDDKKEPMAKAVKDKEKKVEESIFALTNQWKAYKG